MKSIILKLQMFTVALCSSLYASAYDFKVDGLCYNILSDEDRTIEVTYSSWGNNGFYVRGYIELPKRVINRSKTYTLTSIGDWAFWDCSGLISVTIPNSVTSIGDGAFDGCSGLISVTIPNSVTSIGDNAFRMCSGLTSVTIPNSVTSIGWGAFAGCSGLENIYVDPKNTNYSSIDGILYSKDATSIIKVPAKKINVTIPNSVTSIGNYAFERCDNLKTIYMQCEVPIKCSSIFDDNTLKEATLYVPKGTKTTYEKVDPWRNFWNIEEMDFSGVDGMEADDSTGLRLVVNNGSLMIDGLDDNQSIVVYDVQGRVVYRGMNRIIENIASGLYIVKADSQSAKIAI